MSLLDIAQANKTGGIDAYSRLSGMQNQRDAANRSLRDQKKARQANAAGSALATGAATAAMFSTPVGIAVGAGMLAIGLLF